MKSRQKWSAEDIEYLKVNWELPDSELSEHLGRPKGSIRTKRRELGLIGKKNERKADWSQEELDYLHEVWGEKTIPEIAKKLGRSINAVKIKAVRSGHTGQLWSGEMMSARKVSELLGVDVHAVTDYWIAKCGLKAKKKRRGESKQKTTIIMFEDLLSWLETHPDLWDSRRVELYALGGEYPWLKEKRKSDAMLPARKAQLWTKEEDRQLVFLWRQGTKTKREIGVILGRSESSVEHRLSRLDVWGTGRYIPEKERLEKKSAAKEDFERKALVLRLQKALLTYRNSMQYGEYWQKDMCQLWDKIKGCTAGGSNCDECTSFVRIQPQYCVRCGATFFERAEKRICEKCRAARKKQYFKKVLRMRKDNV